jgi:hypothetical protein
MVGSGLLLAGLGQHLYESYCQGLQQALGTAVGYDWSYIKGGDVLLGVVVTFIGLRRWITTAVEQTCGRG